MPENGPFSLERRGLSGGLQVVRHSHCQNLLPLRGLSPNSTLRQSPWELNQTSCCPITRSAYPARRPIWGDTRTQGVGAKPLKRRCGAGKNRRAKKSATTIRRSAIIGRSLMLTWKDTWPAAWPSRSANPSPVAGPIETTRAREFVARAE